MIQPEEKKAEKRILTLSLCVSIFIHSLIIILSLIFFHTYRYQQPGYEIITTIKGSIIKSFEEKTEFSKQNNLLEKTIIPQETEPDAKLRYTNSKIETAGFDSLNLSHIYKESTLNVEIKYPVGWVYLDQQRNKKLDGITFWAVDNSFNPPPYIHIEVVEKYLFNPAKYKYTYKFRYFEGFYNEPEEMEGQVNQQIYIRTKADEDFIIKLIINGKDNFDRFQPIFLAMVNSFQFGNPYIF
jgi:hypothetical protein